MDEEAAVVLVEEDVEDDAGRGGELTDRCLLSGIGVWFVPNCSK